ncbi:MAG TPA: hypothetical protein VMV79_07000 [Alphaproteobacteria bacterium]|nr:hypothetical protein [Alphaproteobacteria bacterium]
MRRAFSVREKFFRAARTNFSFCAVHPSAPCQKRSISLMVAASFGDALRAMDKIMLFGKRIFPGLVGAKFRIVLSPASS